MRDESVLTGESKNLDHSRGSPSRFHFSQSSRQQHPPGQVLFRFRPVARVSYYVNIPSLFLPARRFLLLYLSSVPCQQIIKKRESSSINIAPVFLFFFFPKFPPSGCESTAAVLNHCRLLSAHQHVCMFFLLRRVYLCGRPILF